MYILNFNNKFSVSISENWKTNNWKLYFEFQPTPGGWNDFILLF